MTDGENEGVPLTRLVRDVVESGNDDEGGKYAFLIGAGSSRAEPAGILTGGELVDRWQRECYDWVHQNQNLEDSEEVPAEWIETREEEMDEDESRYGFWFESRYDPPGRRREFIADLVEEATPTLGHIILAKLMSEGYVTNVLTPNFDDLLFDAFYRYLEDKPLLIDHRAVASEFKLTRDRPAIVKLHGDYLYDNLKNTDLETEALDPPMNEALTRTVEEYGLIVVGYSGCDESIMGALLDADISEYGLYWCERSPDETGQSVEDKLSEPVRELLERDRTSLVEIEGFVPLMTQFHRRLDGLELPGHEELVGRATKRADQIQDTLAEYSETADDEEEAAYAEALEKAQEANEAQSKGDYERAIELWNEAIDLDPELAGTYYNRGNAKQNLGEYEAAIEDYDRALDLGPEFSLAYYNRGNAKRNLGEHEAAIEDYDRALDLNPEDAYAYNNRGAAKQNLEEYEAAIEDYDRALDLDPEDTSAYLNRAEACIETGDYQQAREDASDANSLSSSPDGSAESHLLLLVSTLLLGEDTDDLDREYRSICDREFTTFWSSDELDSWLETADLDPDDREQIEAWIDVLREHEPD